MRLKVYFRIFKNISFYIKKERRKLLSFIFSRKYKAIGKIPKVSAYLSIYNDSDILDQTLNSIKDYVDELIVVDGAYEWNASYLKSIGLNPEQSEHSVYNKIDKSGIPYKIIKKVWKNEVEKRMTGFESTSSRYVMRIDADEVIYFNLKNLKNFFASGCYVAEMYMPNYVAPGIVVEGNRFVDKYRKFPRQVCLFDKSKIGAREHLRYLWLVLTADVLPQNLLRQKIYPVFEKPVAFCAHLTNLRCVESSKLRSSFYTMNWMRQNGAPWLDDIKQGPISNFKEFFLKISPNRFLDVMRNSLLVQGEIQLKSSEMLTKSPLTNKEEYKIVEIYKNFLRSLEVQVMSLVMNGGVALRNYPFYIDVTSNDLIKKISHNDQILILFSDNVEEITVNVLTLKNSPPYSSCFVPKFHFNGTQLSIDKWYFNANNILRRSIMVTAKSSSSSKAWVNFRILSK